MNTNNKKLTLKIIEFVLIFLLSAAMIAMFVSFCMLKNSSSYSGIPDVDYRNSDINFVDNIKVPSENVLGLISPSFAGFSGDKKISPVTPEAESQFYNTIRPYITEVFSDISTILEFSSDDKRNAYIEDSIYSREAIYLEFPYELPASTIYPALTGKTLDNIYHSFNVKKLFIFCTDNGTLSGAALDNDGNVATLTVRNRSFLTFDVLRNFENYDGMKEFDFVTHGDRKYAVMTSSVSRFNIVAYTNNGDFLSAGSGNSGTILSAMGFNPNGTHYYRSGEDSVTYVEDTGEISITSSGDISYTKTGNGIELSRFTEKHKDSYSFEDKISAAYHIFSGLDREFFGGYAYPALTCVTYDSETGFLMLDFSYFADGIAIDGETDCARLVFDKNALVSAQISAGSYIRAASSFSDIPQKLLFVFSSQSLESSPHSFMPVYTLDGDGLYKAKFAFVFEKLSSEADLYEKAAEVTDK